MLSVRDTERETASERDYDEETDSDMQLSRDKGGTQKK